MTSFSAFVQLGYLLKAGCSQRRKHKSRLSFCKFSTIRRYALSVLYILPSFVRCTIAEKFSGKPHRKETFCETGHLDELDEDGS